MTVCRFFLEGRCKFGQRCKFEHPRGGQPLNNQQSSYRENRDRNYFSQPTFQYGNTNRNNYDNQRSNNFDNQRSHINNRQSFNNNSKYTYNRQTPQQSFSTTTNPGHEIIQQIKQDVEVWGTSGMWPYSCYSYQKENNCLEDLPDISAEELRVLYYMHGKTAYVKLQREIESQYNTTKLTLLNMPLNSNDPDVQKVLSQVKNNIATYPSKDLKIGLLYGPQHNFPDKCSENNQIEQLNSLSALSPIQEAPGSSQGSTSNPTMSKPAIKFTDNSNKQDDIDLTVYRRHDSIYPLEMEQFTAAKFELDKIPMLAPSKELCF